MDFRLTLAILAGKIIAFLIKLTGGGATAAPGLYALKIDPKLVQKLTAKNNLQSIVISGTNGKTTTARLISEILSKKYKIIHNRQGSNLLRGIASTMISVSSASGKIPANLAIWEVDEATIPEAIDSTSPKIVTLLNLFRDQLDRYGEIDTTRAKWQKSLSRLPQKTTLILNADDPGVSFLVKSFRGKVLYFGVSDQKPDLPEIDHIADIRHCLNCGTSLKYTALLSAHMGHYFCPNCDFKRPTPNVSSQNLQFKSDFSTSLKLIVNGQMSNVSYSLPGLYNVYNILAATTISSVFGINPKQTKSAIENFAAAFGRFQKIKVGDKNIVIFLIKNPTGANEVIRTIAKKDKLEILAILNDDLADGRDVSWIWDTNWEALDSKVNKLGFGGTRAWDLATRLKYAGLPVSKNNVYGNISYSIQKSIHNLNNKDTLLILPTYTALLEVQKSLNKIGVTIKWHQE